MCLASLRRVEAERMFRCRACEQVICGARAAGSYVENGLSTGTEGF